MEVAVLYLRAEVVACRQEAEEVAASYHQEVAVAEEAVLYLRAEVVACRQEAEEEAASCRRAYHILAEEAAAKCRFR